MKTIPTVWGNKWRQLIKKHTQSKETPIGVQTNLNANRVCSDFNLYVQQQERELAKRMNDKKKEPDFVLPEAQMFSAKPEKPEDSAADAEAQEDFAN